MTGITDYYEDLSERELEILRLLADGLTNQEIADRLHLALTTVKWYNTQIYEKLDVKNRKQAVKRAQTLALFNRMDMPPSINLPQDKTPFVGRSAELDDLHALIRQPAKHIITVLAPGGMGKTRLALEAARRQLGHFAHGVYFVPLTPVDAIEYVITTIAENAGYQIQKDQSRAAQQQLGDYLANRHLLLVLDNFEHLLDGAQLLAEIVQVAPNVTLLVTSRERLNLAGETVFALGGMTFPTWETPADALTYDAVILFMQGAKRVRPDFELQADDLHYLARICRFTEGMPLGIELAAGWVDVLTLEQIATEIQQGIDILETELRDVPERHRSIRATIDYSWNGLTQTERDVFMRLSVFRGGFDAEAAQIITGANLRLLRKLVNKALIYAHADGRYDMHELLRQYGADCLKAADLTEHTKTEHARYFALFIEARKTHLMGMDPIARYQIEPEYDNIVAAWTHIITTLNFDLLAHMMDAFWQFLTNFGRNFDGIALFDQGRQCLAAHLKTDEQHVLFGRLLNHLAELYLGVDPQKGYALLKDAIQVLEAFGPSLSLYAAYALHGNYYYENEYLDTRPAHDYLDRAMQIVEQLEEPLAKVNVLHLRGLLYLNENDHIQALQTAEQALALVDSIDNDDPMVESIEAFLGQVYYASGDYEKARPYLLHALEMAEHKAYLYWLSGLRIHLWKTALYLNDEADARHHIREMLRSHITNGQDWQLLGALYGIAHHWYLHIEAYERAAEILSFVQQHPFTAPLARDEINGLFHNQWPHYQWPQLLSADVFTAALERGRRCTLDSLIADILTELEG